MTSSIITDRSVASTAVVSSRLMGTKPTSLPSLSTQ